MGFFPIDLDVCDVNVGLNFCRPTMVIFDFPDVTFQIASGIRITTNQNPNGNVVLENPGKKKKKTQSATQIA